MNKTIFRVSDSTLTDAYSTLCVTFKINKVVDNEDGEQYIVSNWEESSDTCVTRGLVATAEEIRILGSNHQLITHDCTEWTTILIEWGSEQHGRFNGRYTLNDGQTSGTFISTDPGLMLYNKVYIGGKSDRSQFLNGCIASVEWYACSRMPTDKLWLPTSIRQLIIDDQTMPDSDDVTPGSSKRMKLSTRL